MKYVIEVDGNGYVVPGSAVQYNPSLQNYQSHLQQIMPILLFLITFSVITYFSTVIVKQQSVKIIQRLGKFSRVATAGLSFKIPFIELSAGTVDLRVQQLFADVETKTKDNVFAVVRVAVQYNVVPDKADVAFYKLDNPKQQMSSYVFDVVRAKVPTLNLDEVFERKEDIAKSIKEQIATTMDDFGYNIITALVTDIDPNEKVKISMNEINAAKRLREAATEKGEAEKILMVKKAEAEAESKKLQGQGIAAERIAIAEGLETSIEKIKVGSPGEVMKILMLTQYLDTLKHIGNDAKVVFVQHSPGGMNDTMQQISAAIEGGK